MSFWDNVKKFTQPYADDDYDEYEDDEAAVGYESGAADSASRYTGADAEPAAKEKDPFDFGVSASSAPAAAPSAAPAGFSGQVVNLSSNKQQVILFRPVSFNDTSKAADDLRSKKAVIVNMEGTDKAMARRVVDFLSGCAYSLDGSVKKIASCTYLFCPYNMEITGDLENLQNEVENYI